LLLRARIEREAGNFTQSINDCQRVLELNPNSGDGHLCNAEVYSQLGNLGMAADEAQLAIRLKPDLSRAPALFLEIQKKMNAQAAARNPPPPPVSPPPVASPVAPVEPVPPPLPAVATPPPTPPVVVGQGIPLATPLPQPEEKPAPAPVAAMDRTSPASSIVEFKKARAFEEQGRQLAAGGKLKESLDALNESIHLNPRSSKAYNARGYSYLRVKDYNHAIDDFTKAIELKPDYANAFQNRGVARRLAGDLSGASADAAKFLQLGGIRGSGSANRSAENNVR